MGDKAVSWSHGFQNALVFSDVLKRKKHETIYWDILGYIGDLGVSLGQSYSSVKNCMDPSLHPTSGFHPTWW